MDKIPITIEPPAQDISSGSIALREITVCICTYRRAELLSRLLKALSTQRTEGRFFYSCVVIDNDEAASARQVIEAMREVTPFAIRYEVEPERNFASVRNRALAMAGDDLIAFIDDDEVPCEDWLLRLFQTLAAHDSDAVLGPVRPYFDERPPEWILRSRICERPSYPTGTSMHWRNTRTGNVLMRASIATKDGVRFDPAYGSGGEDIDFFRRAAGGGRKFVWCEEAPVFELVPTARLTRKYHLRRALHQGQISFSYANESRSIIESVKVAGTALVAAVAYTVALPVLFICGDHLGMKYLIKDCHHIARLCAMCGISLSPTRKF